MRSNKEKSFWAIYTPGNIYLEALYRLRQWGRKLDFGRTRNAKRIGHVHDHSQAVGDFYDAYHDKFMRVYGPVIQAFRTKDVRDLLDYQIASMGLQAGQRVLDAGCGVAMPAIYFARNAGVQVDAITISRKQYETALSNVEAENLMGQVRVIKGDYHRLPEYFRAESYDVVYFLESFGHSRAKQLLLDVCWKMLKPGGLVYIKDLFKRIPILPEHKKKLMRKYSKSTMPISTTLPNLMKS